MPAFKAYDGKCRVRFQDGSPDVKAQCKSERVVTERGVRRAGARGPGEPARPITDGGKRPPAALGSCARPGPP